MNLFRKTLDSRLSLDLAESKDPYASKFQLAGNFSRGLTLVEVSITVAIIGITVASIGVMNSNAMALVRTNKESTAANAIIQGRVEQMRTANWRVMTSSTYLRDTFLGMESTNGAALGDITEVVTISAWPNRDAVQPIIVRKTSEGVTVVSAGASVIDQTMARFDFDVFWESGGRERMRSTTTIMSRGGLNRFNLAGAPIEGIGGETGGGTGKGNVGGKRGKK